MQNPKKLAPGQAQALPANPTATATIDSFSQVWLDNQDVMQMLHVSSRTLQTWRSKKMIAFAKVRGKLYYLRTDVEKLLQKSYRGVMTLAGLSLASDCLELAAMMLADS